MARQLSISVLVVLLLCSCSTGIGSPAESPAAQLVNTPAPAAPTDSLPEIGQLHKGASANLSQLGSQAYLYGGAWIDGDTLILSGHSDDKPDPGKHGSAVKAATELSEVNGFAYGVFVFDRTENELLTLEIDSGANYDSPFWLAFANWDKGHWDFSPGSFFADPTLDLSDTDNLSEYIRDDGTFALAIVSTDFVEPIEINSISFTVVSEVYNLTSGGYHWNGVELFWDSSPRVEAFRVFRRPEGDNEAIWQLLTPESLSRYDRVYQDITAEGGIPYAYLVQSGFKRSPGGFAQWFWSNGVEVTGVTQVSEFQADIDTDSVHRPFLVGNRLGFVSQQASNGGKVDIVRNAEFTPGLTWDSIDTPEAGFTNFLLSTSQQGMFPLQIRPFEQVNNPVSTFVYSTINGTFCQVCEQQEDGSVEWGSPLLVREAGTYIVALPALPRRIGAVTYNAFTGMLEMVDSADITGRIWYEFEPEIYPWMTIGQYRPDGKVCIEEFSATPIIAFREASSGQLAVVKYGDEGWSDISPEDVAICPDPVMATAAPTLSPPMLTVFHITEDRAEVRAVQRGLDGEWRYEDSFAVVEADPGSEIDDFALFTSGTISPLSYLTYCIDGNLYVRYTYSSALRDWSVVSELDMSGTCRDLQVIKVGSNENWESRHYASYIKQDESGDQIVAFRDLLEAVEF